MESEKFWGLSFYEWSIWVWRIRSIQIQRDDQRVFWGNWMAFYGNTKLKEGADPLKREDFYPISGEVQEEEKEKEKLSPEELQAKIEKALKRGSNSSS